MLIRNSARNLNKQSPSNSSSKVNINRNISVNNKNNAHRIRPIQITSPRKQPVPIKNDFYNYQKSMLSSLPKPA